MTLFIVLYRTVLGRKPHGLKGFKGLTEVYKLPNIWECNQSNLVLESKAFYTNLLFSRYSLIPMCESARCTCD